MKSIWIYLVILFSLAFCTCEIPDNFRVGFDIVFDKTSQGDTIMVVDDLTKILYFEGDVTLTSGAVEILVFKPDASIAYSLILDQPVTFISISKEFESVEGPWTLKYLSVNGTGSLSLTLKN